VRDLDVLAVPRRVPAIMLDVRGGLMGVEERSLLSQRTIGYGPIARISHFVGNARLGNTRPDQVTLDCLHLIAHTLFCLCSLDCSLTRLGPPCHPRGLTAP